MNIDSLVVLIPLFPLFAAAYIGIGHLAGVIGGEKDEKSTSIIATLAITLSCLVSLFLLGAHVMGMSSGSFEAGTWLSHDSLLVRVNFITSGLSMLSAALFAILLFIVIRFSINYMHREPGFHRFFFILSLFASAMMLVVLSGNAVGTFTGWEIAGLCSFLLIAYAYDRPVASGNAVWVFITNRIGDVGFILGIGLSYHWMGTVEWTQINELSAGLTNGKVTIIALCFTIAAFAKSAQLPFSPWLARAAEGPTPSSAVFYGAVMVHAGVYLLCLLQPLFERAPVVMVLIAVVGLSTAIYGFVVGLTQTDVKSSLFCATIGQLGLMFLECGLGFWTLASWHLCAHGIVRGYQVLSAPSLMHNIRYTPAEPISPRVASMRWIYIASLQRFWLDQVTDWAIVKLVKRVAHDLVYLDDRIIDRTMAIPVSTVLEESTLVQLEQRGIDIRPGVRDSGPDRQGGGFAGNLQWAASLLYWFENRLVLRGVGEDAINYGRQLGKYLNRIEEILLRPHYVTILSFISVLIAF